MKICIIVASDGKNLELAQQFETCLIKLGASVRIIDIAKMNLPLYSTSMEKITPPAELVAPFISDLECDGFVFVSPEYNGSTPPVLTNFLAWVSRSGKNWREHFNSKSAAIGSANGGGTNVFTALRMQLSHMGINVLGRTVHVTDSKLLDTKALEHICQQLVKLSASSIA